DQEGNVSARVLLLKGLEKNGFVFFSNYHSRKGEQLSANPKAALTFLWYAMERQIRVEGHVIKISRKKSMAYFQGRPADSQISACISRQSSVIPDRAYLEAIREGLIRNLNGQPPGCPDNWGGYLLTPTRMEFWQGRPHRLHDRLQYTNSLTATLSQRTPFNSAPMATRFLYG
ncbi:MAG: pyridoxamine 5'-phosphate oxidase, partial [Bacteroidetes bacterium]|nr:pyridoxamine 5'-phosphate oxidase [Bacteroidota bacterium]